MELASLHVEVPRPLDPRRLIDVDDGDVNSDEDDGGPKIGRSVGGGSPRAPGTYPASPVSENRGFSFVNGDVGMNGGRTGSTEQDATLVNETESAAAGEKEKLEVSVPLFLYLNMASRFTS